MTEEYYGTENYDAPEAEDTYDPNEDWDMDVFNETFEHTLFWLYNVYSIHRETKGDSWQEMSPEQLRILLNQEIEEYNAAPRGAHAEVNELLDVILIAMMLVERLAKKDS